MNQDREQLQLLSIFHYVVAGIVALSSSFLLIHLVVGLAIFTGVGGHQARGSEFFGLLFVGFAAFGLLAGWTLAGLIFFAGRNIAKRTRYLYCQIVAGIECMFMPFGTVLGIFTLIVLSRESVKALFLGGAPPGGPPPAAP